MFKRWISFFPVLIIFINDVDAVCFIVIYADNTLLIELGFC